MLKRTVMLIKHPKHLDVTKRGRPRKARLRAEGTPGRKAMPARQAEEIRQRLKQFVADRVGTAYELVEAYGLSRSTVNAWFAGTSRAVPDVKSLQPLIDLGLSLDWLYTGRGHSLRVDASESPLDTFRSM